MGLTRSSDKKYLNENIQWLTADLSLPAHIEDVKNFKPNVVIHLIMARHTRFFFDKIKN